MWHVMSLRRVNRLAQFKNRKAREVTAQERGLVDLCSLQLQNVESEIGHLHNEITRCLQFESADEDIELVPVEDFRSNASAELKEAAVVDAHQERIARLKWELAERKSLVGTLQEREGRKNVLISDISTKENRLTSLKPMVESLIESSRPVLELMGLSASSSSSEHRKLRTHLPKELFLVLTQVQAYADIAKDEGVVVRCDGDLESALKMEESDQRVDSADDDDDDSTDADADRSPSRVRRRRSTLSEQLARKREAVLAPHPIHLLMDVTCNDGITVSLKLQYIPHLRSVGVIAKLKGSSLPFLGNILCDESILMELYPGDTGDKCPIAVSQVKLDHFQMKASDYEGRVGRMFEFAQRMASLSESTEAQLCDVVQSVVDSIRSRVRSRCALIKAIQSLRALKPFDDMSAEQRSEHPAKVSSQLSSFSVLSAEEFFTNALVTEDYRSVLDADLNGNKENRFYFSAVVERRTAKLTALIAVGAGYPCNDTPFFILGLSIDGKRYDSKSMLLLRNLEHELNVGLVERQEIKEADSLLSTQMAFLVSRCDVLLEVNSALAQQHDFPREHLFSRLTRGRDQQPPMLYDNVSNAFTFS